ncbi:MAG: metal ABC transporter permease [Planctomycetota bacterium]|nr:metal ABC transporter permease [Planctomycetota bacterium]
MDGLDGVSWSERLSLFRWAIAAALVAGAVYPLLGTFLHVRRTSFYGIALPQFATAGMVCGFAVLPWWIETIGLAGLDLSAATSDSHAAMNYHLAWAALFTFGGLALLLWLGQRGGGSEVGRVAAAFAIASAATVLFGRVSPVGKGFVDELVAGELLGVGVHEFETIAVVLGLSALVFWLFHRDLLLASYDRETALVLGKRVLAFEGLLVLVTGAMVSVGAMALGPILLFGMLVLPPIAARAWARSMTGYLLLSSAFGVAAALVGIVASFELDLPMGAAIAACAALLALPGALFGRRAA